MPGRAGENFERGIEKKRRNKKEKVGGLEKFL